MASSQVGHRRAVEIHRLTAEERAECEDCRWAERDPEILAKYVGQFVVPYRRQIVAHGFDIELVLQEAVRVTGKKPNELPICAIDDPLMDIPH
ncbi:MAG: hypothetical protein HY000_01685 [Planctomycetes bacterium]|nr:hypothetical protein [Planctomycetota bacterium]